MPERAELAVQITVSERAKIEAEKAAAVSEGLGIVVKKAYIMWERGRLWRKGQKLCRKGQGWWWKGWPDKW